MKKILLFFLATVSSLGLYAAATANFTVSYTPACGTVLVNFTDLSTSTGTITSRTWYWGDASAPTSTSSTTISRIYSVAGTYCPYLVITDNTGDRDTFRATGASCITVYAFPTISLAIRPNSGCNPLTPCITNLSTAGCGTLTSAVFDVGGGRLIDTLAPNFCLPTYTAPGNYSLTVRLVNSCGCIASAVLRDTIKVEPPVVANFSASTTFSCTTPRTISFTNLSTGSGPGGLRYAWDLNGDGIYEDSTANPTRVYTLGTYTVSLIAYNTYGCRDTTTFVNYINITTQPTASFTANTTPTCGTATINCTSTSTAGATGLSWTVLSPPPGGTGSGSTFTYTATGSGVVRIQLTATYSGGCTDDTIRNINVTVLPRPTANYVSSGCLESCRPPLTVSYTNTSVGSSTCTWSFPGGTPATSASCGTVSVTYNAAGTYLLPQITVVNASGCRDSIRLPGNVRIQPIDAQMYVPVRAGCAPVSLEFRDTSITNQCDSIVSRLWSFGTGGSLGSSTLRTPRFTFPDTGCFDVRLIVTSGRGCTDTVFTPAAVCIGDTPVVTLLQGPNVMCFEELPVNFDIVGQVDSCFFIFGDGLNGISRDTISHLYQDTGTFVPQIRCWYRGCGPYIFLGDTIQVRYPVAKFRDSTWCGDRFRRYFINTSINIDSSFWDFGDTLTTLDTSSSMNSTYRYSTEGCYNVKLMVWSFVSGCFHQTINRICICTVIPDFRADTRDTCINARIRLVNTSNCTRTGNSTIFNPTNRGWLGAGPITQTAPYAFSCFNTVRMVNIAPDGCRDTVTKVDYVRIRAMTPRINSNIRFGCGPLAVQFYDSTLTFCTSVTRYRWDFGIASRTDDTSALRNPVFVFDQPGSYSVTCRFFDSLGCQFVSTPIVINVFMPIATITNPDSINCTTTPINISATIVNALRPVYSWSLPGGVPSSSTSLTPPPITYSTPGLYTLTFTLTDTLGCDTVLTDRVFMYDTRADFTASDTFFVCNGGTINFYDSSRYDICSWFWDFGDGTNSTLANPGKIYSTPGTYTVSLIVTSCDGCSDTIVKQDYIRIQGPNGSFRVDPSVICLGSGITTYTSATNTATLNYLNGEGTSIPISYFPIIPEGDTVLDTISYVYNDTGIYYPQMLLTDTSGCSIAIDPRIPVTVDSLVVYFSANQLSYCDSGTICFYDSSLFLVRKIGATQFSWDFGDGTPISTSKNACHKYTSPGLYRVRLFASSTGICGDSSIQYVFIKRRPRANFLRSDSLQCIAEPAINFTDASTSDTTLSRWFWDFRPTGSSSTLRNTSFDFTTAGTFTILLRVTDTLGCVDSTTRTVRVINNPVANAGNDTTICYGRNGRLSGSGGVSYLWSPSTDLSSVSISNPVASPDTTISYFLQVTDSAGCIDLDTMTMNVSSVLARYTNDTVCRGASTRFTDRSGINLGSFTTWAWNFGDPASGAANTSALTNPTHLYTNSGVFPTRLTVTNSFGCTDDTLLNVSVLNLPIPNFRAAPICLRDSMRFTDLSSSPGGVITAWRWNFGVTTTTLDTSNIQNPSYLYTTAGIFNVTLTAYNSGCFEDTVIAVRVWPLPTANFRADSACANQNNRFTDLSTGTYRRTGWRWDFGDPGITTDTSRLQNPLFTYGFGGSFPVTLTVTDSNGCQDDTIRQAISLNLPFANFTTDTVCFGDSTHFRDVSLSSAGTINSWNYSFGDPASGARDSSLLRNPSHWYTNFGNFSTRFTVRTNFGCSDDTIMNVPVQVSPRSNFRAPAVCLGDTMRFTDLSTAPVGLVSGWVWNFGDPLSTSDTSRTQNPTYYYPRAGTYNVRLTAGNASCNKDTVITVRVWSLPTARFRTDTSCISGLSTMTNQSTGGARIIDSRWDFGDLTSTSDTQHANNGTYLYPSPGTYTVRLVVTDSNSCIDDTTRNVIVIAPPVAIFRPDTLCPGERLTLIDSSTTAFPPFTRRLWDFGDISTTADTSTAINATYTYTSAGSYFVNLRVWDRFGCFDDTLAEVFVVLAPIADFTADSTCTKDTISFRDQSLSSSGGISNWFWDFGDGGLSTLQDPSYYFNYGGNQNITLRVRSSYGCEDTITKPIYIFQGPLVNFRADTACFGDSTIMLSLSTAGVNPISTYLWNITPTDSSSDQNVGFVFNNPGTYPVTLTVTDLRGCDDDTTINVFVRTLPIASYDNTIGCQNGPVSFTNTSLNGTGIINNWNWTFGTTPPGSSTAVNPTFSFPDTFSYSVTLLVTDNFGCQDDTVKFVQINSNPDAIFGLSPSTEICLGQQICFFDSSTVVRTPIRNWFWDMDSDLLPEYTTQNPCHTYSVSGNYTVTLTVIDSNSCQDTARINIIVNQPPIAAFDWDTTCENSPMAFLDRSIPQSGVINNWNWSFGDGTGDIVQNPSHAYVPAGSYTVSLIILDDNNCSDTATQVVLVDAPTNTVAFSDTSICIGNSVDLYAIGAVTYNWSPSNGLNRTDTSFVRATPDASLVYTVTGYSLYRACPPTQQNVLVQVIPQMPFDVKGEPLTVVRGTSAQLTGLPAGPIDSIRWTPDITLNCSDCIDPIATPSQTTTYYASIYYNLIGAYCNNTDSVTINVLDVCPKEIVFIPNTFTPNGDGQNDVFLVRGYGLDLVNLFRVFDRWGNLLFEKTDVKPNDLNEGWNGSSKNGTSVNPGVYVYYTEVTCSNGDKLTFSGNITLIR